MEGAEEDNVTDHNEDDDDPGLQSGIPSTYCSSVSGSSDTPTHPPVCTQATRALIRLFQHPLATTHVRRTRRLAACTNIMYASAGTNILAHRL